jgi:fluoroacetyl-CoA thioesterase
MARESIARVGNVRGVDLPQPKRGDGTPIEIGAEREDEFTVEGPLLTDVGGTLGASVLSTPGMIGMMERTAAVLSYEHLPEGSATVGFEVCVKHVGGAAEGSSCRVRAKLTDFQDGRKLFFDVEVLEGDRTIGVGTHQRRVVGVPKPEAG